MNVVIELRYRSYLNIIHVFSLWHEAVVQHVIMCLKYILYNKFTHSEYQIASMDQYCYLNN